MSNKSERFPDFVFKAFFALLIGISSLMAKVLIDIESNIRAITTDVSILSSNSLRHERELERQSSYSLVLQRVESELSFQKQQIEALRTKQKRME